MSLLLALAAALSAISSVSSPSSPSSIGRELQSGEVHPARDETSERRAFVEVEAVPGPVFAGQRVAVRVILGIEETFLETRMVQPFGVRLDVPAQVTWPGVAVVPEPSASPARIAWNEAVQSAERVADRREGDRTYRVYATQVRLPAASPPSMHLSGPTLAYAYATRFEEGFLAGTVPADRVDAVVSAPAIDLEVAPLPEAGRPEDFTGAVGEFTIDAEAPTRAVDLGRSLKLLLRVRGSGNLDAFEAPRWKEIGGFRVLGVLDEKRPDERRFTIDLAPFSASVRQIPAVTFPYFNPDAPAGYRSARSEPIDVEVRKLPEGAPTPTPAKPVPPPRSPESSSPVAGWIAGAAAGVLVLAIFVRRSRRPLRTPSP